MGFLKDRFKRKYDEFVSHNAYSDNTYAGQTGDPMEAKRRSGFSRAYHRYFEGYAEREIIDADGKKRIERVYVLDSYKHRLDDRHWALLKAGYCVLFAVICTVYIWTVAAHSPFNKAFYVEVPEAAGAFSLFLLLYTLIQYVTAKRVMTIYDFKESSEKLLTRTIISAVLTALPLPAAAVYLLINGGTGEGGAIAAFAAKDILTALLLTGWHLTEKKLVKYDRIPYDKDIPGDTVVM